jgi:hypothetical protein
MECISVFALMQLIYKPVLLRGESQPRPRAERADFPAAAYYYRGRFAGGHFLYKPLARHFVSLLKKVNKWLMKFC